MPRRIRSLRFSLIALAVLAPCVTAYAQYGDLVRRIPNTANTIVLLNVEDAVASPLGVKEGWRENHEKQFEAGLVLVPPQSSKFVMAAQLDFPELAPKWQISLCDLRYEPSLPKVAAKLNGTVDNIGDRNCAVVPGDLCIVKFGPRVAGTFTPAIRQDVSRWLNSIDLNETGKLSPYMTASVKFAEQGAPLIMAIDLADVFSAEDLRPRLDEMESLKGLKVDRDQLAKALASIQGVSLGVTISERRFGKIKVDFTDDVTFMRPFAKPLLLEVIANRGAMIDEFAAWDLKVSGNQISIEGTLLASGMRRIMSLLDAPPELQEQSAQSSQVNPDDPKEQQKLVALASQQYFKQISSMLDDLRLKRSEAGFVTWNQVGTWFEKYARKIDRLPILNVDPEMVQYGAWVAAALRDAENSLKGIGPAAREKTLELPDLYNVQTYSAPIGVNWSGSYGWGGWTASRDLRAEGRAMSTVRTQEKIRGNMAANSTAQGIEQATADMRRYMTQKYQIEF